MISDEHGLAADGSWRGETSLQAERLRVYWDSQGGGQGRHPGDQETLLKVGGWATLIGPGPNRLCSDWLDHGVADTSSLSYAIKHIRVVDYRAPLCHKDTEKGKKCS